MTAAQPICLSSKRFIAIVISFFLCSFKVAAADAYEIGAHVWSHHTNPAGCAGQVTGLAACQNDTPGIYVRQVREGMNPVVGYFRNSVSRPTWYAGVIVPAWRSAGGRLEIEVAIAAATGYPAAKIVPLVMPAARLNFGNGWATSAGVLPRVGDLNPTWVVHFTISKRFGRQG